MEFKGKCGRVDTIIVSDPYYKRAVWCRYERHDIGGRNWNVVGQINAVSDDFEGISYSGKELVVALSAQGSPVKLGSDGSFRYVSGLQLKEYTIGMDTASVGIRRENQAGVPPLRTLTDGEFGRVFEGSDNGKVQFIVISGYLDDDAGYSEEDILRYLVDGLGIELEKGKELRAALDEAKTRAGGPLDVEQEQDFEKG